MNMPIFKMTVMKSKIQECQNLLTSGTGFLLIATVLIGLGSCKKDYVTDYGVLDEPVNSQYIKKGKQKNDAQYISILSTNIMQKPISVNELVKTENVIYSIGDRSLAYEIIISNYMNSPDKQLPSDSLMRADVDAFMKDTYRRFYVRDPSELELTFFRNFLDAHPNITVELIYTAFAASEEYRFY